MAGTRRPKGEGRLRQRPSGLWEATLTVTDHLGRSKPRSFYGHTKASALANRDAYRAELARGAPPDPSRLPLSRYLTEWLEGDARTHVAPGTIPTYTGLVKRHIAPLLGHLSLSQLTPAHVQAMVDELTAQGHLAPASIAKCRSVLQSALGDAIRRGLIHTNPAQLARVSHRRRHEIDYWQPAEARTFLAYLQQEDHPLEAFYTCSLMLGWRISEALGLSWDDVDLERGTITIRRGLERSSTARSPRFTPTKNRSSQRTLRLPRAVLTSLTAHRDRQRFVERIMRSEHRWSGDETPHDFVFTTAAGRPYQQANIRRQFRALCTRAGVRPIRVHEMRHTAASLMIRSGVSIKALSDTLGHQSIRVTLDIYGHLFDEQKQDVADAMDRMLGGL